jgi:hypothetical protein
MCNQRPAAPSASAQANNDHHNCTTGTVASWQAIKQGAAQTATLDVTCKHSSCKPCPDPLLAELNTLATPTSKGAPPLAVRSHISHAAGGHGVSNRNKHPTKLCCWQLLRNCQTTAPQAAASHSPPQCDISISVLQNPGVIQSLGSAASCQLPAVSTRRTGQSTICLTYVV